MSATQTTVTKTQVEPPNNPPRTGDTSIKAGTDATTPSPTPLAPWPGTRIKDAKDPFEEFYGKEGEEGSGTPPVMITQDVTAPGRTISSMYIAEELVGDPKTAVKRWSERMEVERKALAESQAAAEEAAIKASQDATDFAFKRQRDAEGNVINAPAAPYPTDPSFAGRRAAVASRTATTEGEKPKDKDDDDDDDKAASHSRSTTTHAPPRR